ncbi:MAG: DNA translocase FtsK [Caldilineales bacterium]|nr:DNA translocase FtsK [Caldilineales bacterium]
MSKRPATASSTSKRKPSGSSTRSGAKSAAKSGRQPAGLSLRSGALWGVVLAGLGLFTLLSLLSRPAGLTGWWVQQLTAGFGFGRYLVPFILLGLGVFIFLRSGGHAGGIGPPQIAGLLLLWLVFQATAHLLVASSVSSTGDLTASGPNGGGGWVGWFLADLLTSALGIGLALAALLGLAAAGLILALGISLADLRATLPGLTASLAAAIMGWGERLHREPGVIRVRPSRSERFRAWLQSLRAAPETAGSPFDDLDGPITTLPPDPNMVHTPPPAPAPPTIRIIGAEQTNWRLPQIEHILEDLESGDLSEEDLTERARIIEDTLSAFGVPVTVIEVNRGPVVTQFGLKPGFITKKVRGEELQLKVRVSQIQALSNDLSLALAASPIRIEAPVPGRNIVGLEVPNRSVTMVSLRSILESEEFQRLKGPLRISLGQDVSGRAVAASLSRMPHLLVAGATGSGKSVCINALICSLLFQYTPDQLRFVMVDPKRVELTGYNGIPHLIDSVVTDIEKVIGVLHWATTEMDRRYKELERAGARNIDVYNAQRAAQGKSILPFVVIVVDELADIMMTAPDDVEKSLVRLAQMARATGIHLVIATQRPSVNVVTGLIKANFPSRIAFAVTSQIDSRVILDTPGAERLLGRGDMLFMRPDSAKLARLQGAFVSDLEVNRLVRFWHGQGGAQAGMRPLAEMDFPADDEPAVSPTAPPAPPEPSVQRPLWDDMLAQAEQQAGKDALYDRAVEIVREAGKASTSLLQRRLQIGYTRAARLIDMMEEAGVIGPDLGGTRGREVVGAKPEASS